MRIWIYVRRTVAVYQLLAGVFGGLRVFHNAGVFLGLEHGKVALLLSVIFLVVLPCWAGIWLWTAKGPSPWRKLFPSLVMQIMQIIWFGVRRRKYIKVACGGANQYDIVHEDLRCSLSKACYGFTVLG
jgi:hypothetical protein